jgi:hypothetical protein
MACHKIVRKGKRRLFQLIKAQNMVPKSAFPAVQILNTLAKERPTKAAEPGLPTFQLDKKDEILSKL